MEIIKTIPEQTNVPHYIANIGIDIVNKIAHVHVQINGDVHENATVDLQAIIDAATDPQKAIIRGFFKKIIAEAVEILEADVPDPL